MIVDDADDEVTLDDLFRQIANLFEKVDLDQASLRARHDDVFEELDAVRAWVAPWAKGETTRERIEHMWRDMVHDKDEMRSELKMAKDANTAIKKETNKLKGCLVDREKEVEALQKETQTLSKKLEDCERTIESFKNLIRMQEKDTRELAEDLADRDMMIEEMKKKQSGCRLAVSGMIDDYSRDYKRTAKVRFVRRLRLGSYRDGLRHALDLIGR
jgi:SMC interacting uncharacterized protein involved in chromosome segregation